MEFEAYSDLEFGAIRFVHSFKLDTYCYCECGQRLEQGWQDDNNPNPIYCCLSCGNKYFVSLIKHKDKITDKERKEAIFTTKHTKRCERHKKKELAKEMEAYQLAATKKAKE